MVSFRKKHWIACVAVCFLMTAPAQSFAKSAEAAKGDQQTRNSSENTPSTEALKVASVETTGFGFSAAASELKLTVDQVLEIVTDSNLQEDGSSRRLALQQVIGKRFDFQRMAMHTLDKDWDRRSAIEQKQFTHLFKKLLEKSYLHIIENFQGGKVHFLSERVKGDYAFIKTHIVSEDRTIAIHYKLKREGESWRVYDFLVQGVSMVRNYRFQFTKVIRQESFSGLLKRLREQTA